MASHVIGLRAAAAPGLSQGVEDESSALAGFSSSCARRAALDRFQAARSP
ncbi:hypothetical protein ACWD9K_37570 [Streptomyces sp. 900116325]